MLLTRDWPAGKIAVGLTLNWFTNQQDFIAIGDITVLSK